MSRQTKADKPRPRRQAGRPSEGDSVGRDTILQSAIQLLRQQSADKLTLSDVAGAAKVDRALVRYYFGDKTGVLKAVAVHVLRELQGRSQAMFLQEGSLEEKIRRRLELLIDVMHEVPQLVELIYNEIYLAEQDEGAEGGESIAQSVATQGLALTRTLIESEEVDAIGRRSDPRFLHLMILGSCVFYANAGPLLQRMFGDRSQERGLTDEYIRFVTQMLMRGLGAPLPEKAVSRNGRLRHYRQKN